MSDHTNVTRLPFKPRLVEGTGGKISGAVDIVGGAVAAVLWAWARFNRTLPTMAVTGTSRLNDAELELYGTMVLDYVERYHEYLRDFYTLLEIWDEYSPIDKAKIIWPLLRHSEKVSTIEDEQLVSEFRVEMERLRELQKKWGDEAVKQRLWESVEVRWTDGALLSKAGWLLHLVTLFWEIAERSLWNAKQMTSEEVIADLEGMTQKEW